MYQDMPAKFTERFAKTLIVALFLGLGTLTLSYDAIFPSGDTFELDIGDIAPEDIFAPEDRTYISVIRTEEKRQEARQRVGNRYVAIPDVSLNQRNLAQDIINYINLIRDNPYYSDNSPEKLTDLNAIDVLANVDDATWLSILEMRDTLWSRISSEVIQVLDRALSQSITEETVAEEVRQLRGEIRGSFLVAEENIIIALVGPLVVPTQEFDPVATREAQEAEAGNVVSQEVSYRKGSLIIAKGQVIQPVDMEALEQFGFLLKREATFRIVVGSFLLLLLTAVVCSFYIAQFYPSMISDYRMLGLVAFLFLEFLIGARLFSAEGFDQAGLFPAAAMSLLLTTLAGPHLAVIATAALAILVGNMVDDSSLQFAAQTAAGGFVGILILSRSERQNTYFFAGAMIGITNTIVATAIQLTGTDDPTTGFLVGQAAIAFVGGIFAAGIALVELGVISGIMNLATTVRLIDLMRPDQPLLQRLLREAPGTFQHSLQVANLAELATERIGGNATLVRVAALYHDIGKMLNPYFFVENQKGINPHDTINDPLRSAQILISHVTEGDRMARRYRLPQRIRDFVREHHGTTKPFFYYRALELSGGDTTKINETDYAYPGPIPQTKETAIMMLADSIESAARGIRPSNEEEVTGVVNMIFEKVLQEGQLDESHLTLNDLKNAREVFIDTLQGIYHTRIKYPGQEEASKLAAPRQSRITGELAAQHTNQAEKKRQTTEIKQQAFKESLDDETVETPTPLKLKTEELPPSNGKKENDTNHSPNDKDEE